MWVKAEPSPSWTKHPIKRYKDKIRFFEFKNWYIRFYPNPGFMIKMFGREIKWSKFDGWKTRKVVKSNTVS